VPLCGAALVANRRHSLLGVGLVEFENVDRRALLSETNGDRLADTAGTTGDDCGLTVEPK